MEPNPEESHCDRVDLAAAYVLGELSSAELDEFARHLQSCEICQEEVELLEAAQALTVIEPIVEPPKPRAPSPDPPPTPLKPRLRTIRGGGGGPQPPPRRRILRNKFSVFAAVLLVGVLMLILIKRTDQVPAARYIRFRSDFGGRAYLKVQANTGEILVEGLPLPPYKQRYEIWVTDKGTVAPAPTGVYINLDADAEAAVNIPGNINNVLAVYIIQEPINGPQTLRQGAIAIAYLPSKQG